MANIQYTPEILKMLDYQAKKIGQNMGRRRGHHFKGCTHKTEYEIEPNKDGIWFWIKGKKGHAGIHFKNFRGLSPENIKIHEPVLSEEETIDTHVDVINNPTDVESVRTYSHTLETSNNAEHEVGVAVTVGFEQKLSIGNEASFYSGELTFSQQIQSHYVKYTGTEEVDSATSTTEVKIPAHTKVTVTNITSRAKFSQEIEYTAPLDFGIFVYARDRFKMRWDSKAEMMNVARGTAGPGTDGWKEFFGDPISEREQKMLEGAAKMKFKETVKFEKATNGQVNIKATKLK